MFEPLPHAVTCLLAGNALLLSKLGVSRALAGRNARLLTAASFVSTTGTWLQLVAQNWLVLQLTHSTAAVGLTVGLQASAAGSLSLTGGLVADRVSRRALLVTTQLTQAVL